MKPNKPVISTRVTKSFLVIFKKFMERDAHVTPAELLRNAIREKIKGDAPDLYNELLRGCKNEPPSSA